MCRLPADAPRLLGADENTSKRLNRISRRSLSSDVQAASACVDSIQWICRPFGKVFLRVRTIFGWEINFPTPDGECRQNTHPARHNCARTAHHRTHCASTVTHHANTRGSSRLPWWCVNSILSSQRHVSYVAALVKEPFNTISLTYFTYLPTIFSLTVLSFGIGSRNSSEIHGGVAAVLNLHLPQVVSPRWSKPTTTSSQEELS